MDLPKAVAIVGTNASGKSSIGLALAQAFNAEIISADSRQIYRGFDLCSGKVSRNEQQLVPHHAIDIRDIGEAFSVADFQALAYAAIPQIISRGKLPLIVGGTGLYVGSVAHGYKLDADDEPTDHALRDALEKLSLNELRERLSDESREFLRTNPSDYNNKRRIIRVLEKTARGLPLTQANSPKYDMLQIGVTWPKEILHRRIEERLYKRIEQGMLDEVATYLNGGGNPEFLYKLGLEYRYIFWYLSGKFATMDEFFLEMSRAIKRFAKRQMTWFRNDETIRWLDMANEPLAQAKGMIADFLQNKQEQL